MKDPSGNEHAGQAGYLAVIGSLLLCAANCKALDSASIPVSVSVDGDQVAVTASDVPLQEVLEAISDECGLEFRSSNDLPRRVTLHGSPMPIEKLLRSILRDESYLLLRTDAGIAQSLWIFTSDGGSEATQAVSDHEIALDRAIMGMSDPDVEVREEAVLSLGDIRGQDVVPLLTQALADDAAGVREAAEALLEDMSE